MSNFLSGILKSFTEKEFVEPPYENTGSVVDNDTTSTSRMMELNDTGNLGQDDYSDAIVRNDIMELNDTGTLGQDDYPEATMRNDIMELNDTGTLSMSPDGDQSI